MSGAQADDDGLAAGTPGRRAAAADQYEKRTSGGLAMMSLPAPFSSHTNYIHIGYLSIFT